MPADTQTRRGCQFSLRTFLVACLVLGLAAGLLGRLFFQKPEVFFFVVSLLTTVGPFLAAIGTIVWIGLGHRPDRRWGLVAWGVFLAVMPIVGIGMVFLVLLDGQPLEVRRNHQDAEDWSGYHDGSLSAGEYQLTVEVECAYVDRDKLIGLNPRDLPAERWPNARKRWKQAVSAPLKVYPPDVAIVRLTKDPGLSPGKAGGIAIERFVVQADAKGKKTIILKLAFDEGLPVPISYDVSVVLGGQTVALGRAWAVEQENRRTASGSQLRKQIDALAPEVTHADVILTPNPRHIEHRPEVSEIWGEKTILQGVRIERLDLEAGQADDQP
jgi:hypothetical protein